MTPREEVERMAAAWVDPARSDSVFDFALAVARYAERRALKRAAREFDERSQHNEPAFMTYDAIRAMPSEYE